MRGCSNSASEAVHASIAGAVEVLATGGIVVYPTETLYGLGAAAFNTAALRRLSALKVRPPGKPIAVLISDLQMMEALAADVPAPARVLMRRWWPGPLTLVFRAQPALSRILTGDDDGVGVRLSSHPIATALVEALGTPVTTPSANPAGLPAPVTVAAACAYFGAQVDYYLDGGTLRGEPASTVVDVRDGWKLIREGAITAEAIRAALDEGT